MKHFLVTTAISFLLAAQCPPLVTPAVTTGRDSGSSQSGNQPDPHTMPVRLSESDRVREYHRRNYTWPLQNYVPNTPGWRKLMEDRFAQVAAMPNEQDRFFAYMQTMNTALLIPNFTEHGIGLARCPEKVINMLRQEIRDGLASVTLEKKVQVISGPLRPWFIDRADLMDRVSALLKPYAEAWSGLELEPFGAYGFRLYRNESALWMHVDKVQTHIISFILHVDSSDDSEPWPIFIEDLYGRTHEVFLTPGDLLFYESAKCLHGRPRPFNGTWYSSIFVHYYPKQGWHETNHKLEANYAIPPIWKQQQEQRPDLEVMVYPGTSMKEPNCPYNWCRAAKDTVKWSGPAEDGYWIDAFFNKHELKPKLVHDEL